ncbi:MAG TPA: prenyltransferase/squalene oxidase repeat-containing protein, partial [Chthoniobacteraceae bacterium]|nr:prenyltransferase/squalene oxidase repeat-containing protein [Chthoniobacteraceae bacterium]
FAQSEQHRRADAIIGYLESLARGDGGYAWEDQEQSHLTPTFAVIGCYKILGQLPPNPARVAEFVRTHHPAQLKKLEQERRMFEFQQVQSLVWLGADAGTLREKIAGWKTPLSYLKQYERHGYPIFQSELGAFTCRALLRMPLDDLAPHLIEYLDARRRANGSFNNTPAADGSDGHVMNTLWGLQALDVLGRASEKKAETIAWLRACQLPESGAFTWQPNAPFAAFDDVAYTRAAVRGLKLLGAAPLHRDACVASLLALANPDGGFGDRAGWLSNPLATYCALDALEQLEAVEKGIVAAEVQRTKAEGERSGRARNDGGRGTGGDRIDKDDGHRPTLQGELRVFSVQLEAHGQGSPAEAVDLARALRIHMWGAKNAKPGWIARAQAIADAQKVPVTFFVANEEYGTWMDFPGLGTYSHMSDMIAPARKDTGTSLANNAGALSWSDFRERRLESLTRGGGRLIWQFGENEELARLLLDDSVARGGYAAISTFHFGNPDFTNSEPFLHRWRGQLPYVALQDAHGPEPWWFADMTTGFRTVFLATEPTWDAWIDALKSQRVAAVRHDAASGNRTSIHASSRDVRDFILAHDAEWRWWDNPEIARPLVSIVAVRPEDEFEIARPASAVTLRVRCAWENTAQGLLKRPLAELRALTVDGAKVSPMLETTRAPRGGALL